MQIFKRTAVMSPSYAYIFNIHTCMHTYYTYMHYNMDSDKLYGIDILYLQATAIAFLEQC